MAQFPKLEAPLSDIERAESMFSTVLEHTYDDEKIANATAAYNRVLEQAAEAIKADLDNPTLADEYLAEWRPKSRMDTWFGPEPLKYLQHILEEGALHQLGMPDKSSLR